MIQLHTSQEKQRLTACNGHPQTRSSVMLMSCVICPAQMLQSIRIQQTVGRRNLKWLTLGEVLQDGGLHHQDRCVCVSVFVCVCVCVFPALTLPRVSMVIYGCLGSFSIRDK